LNDGFVYARCWTRATAEMWDSCMSQLPLQFAEARFFFVEKFWTCKQKLLLKCFLWML